MKPLFGGFFAYGGVLRRWGNPMMMADGVDAQSDDDGGRWGCAIRWMAGKWRTSGTQSLV